MAKAFVVDLKNPPELEITNDQVILCLSSDEAEILVGVSGQGASGGLLSPFYYALRDAGVRTARYKVMNGSKYSGFQYAGTLTVQAIE